MNCIAQIFNYINKNNILYLQLKKERPMTVSLGCLIIIFICIKLLRC